MESIKSSVDRDPFKRPGRLSGSRRTLSFLYYGGRLRTRELRYHVDRVRASGPRSQVAEEAFCGCGFNLEREGPKAETIIVGRVTKLESKSRYGLA